MTLTLGPGDELVRLARTAVENAAAVDHARPAEPATGGRRWAALAWLETHGFPTRKDEDWRYLPLASVLATVPGLPGPPGPAADAGQVAGWDTLVPDLGGPMLVFANGRFVPEGSRVASLPEGMSIAGGDGLAGNGDAGDYRHAFEALNAALAADEITLRVEPGVVVDAPVHLVYVSAPDGGQPVLASPRTRLVAGQGCRAHLVETFVGIAGASGFTNAVTTVHCEEGAHVELDRLQDETTSSWHLSLLAAGLSPHSRLRVRSVALGAAVARHEVQVRLAGDDAQVELDGLYLTRGEQHHDHPILVEHLAPKTRSRQRYQGVADDGGHGVFDGRIIVHPGARGADAAQVNRNLLLSERAEIDTRPRLEIFDDDVRCTHGATVGRLDEAALYYLRSRGIPHRPARALLIHAAVDQAVQRVRSTALQADIARRVAAAVDPRDAAP